MVDITDKIDALLAILDGDDLERAFRQLLIFADTENGAVVTKAWGLVDDAIDLIKGVS